MRKISLLMTLALILTSLFTSTSFAESSTNENSINYTQKILKFEAVEITDQNILLEMAKNNISDIDGPKPNASITKGEGDVRVYSTSQLLKVEENLLTKNVEETYSTTNFVVASLSSKTDSKWDDSYGVVARSTIYWTNYQNHYGDGQDFVKLNQITGSWTRESSLSISNRQVILTCSGAGPSASGYIYQRETKSPTSNSFTYNAKSSWDPVLNESYDMFMVGGTMNCDITRIGGGGAVWELSFDNWL